MQLNTEYVCKLVLRILLFNLNNNIHYLVIYIQIINREFYMVVYAVSVNVAWWILYDIYNVSSV